MSTLTVSEYDGIGTDPRTSQQAAIEPALAVQSVSFTGTAGTSAAFNASTKLVRICVSAAASFRFTRDGSAATTSYAYIAAGAPEYFNVEPGMYVSAIVNSAA